MAYSRPNKRANNSILSSTLELAAGGVKADGTTYTASEVSTALTLPKTGGTINGALTLPAGTNNALTVDGSTFTGTQLKNALTTPAAALPVAGGTMSGTLNMSGSTVIATGSGLTKQVDAGKIGYQAISADSLDIVGAGLVNNYRKITLYDNVHIVGTTAAQSGNLTTFGGLTVGGGLHVKDGTWSFTWAGTANTLVTVSLASPMSSTPLAGVYIFRITPVTASNSFFYSGFMTINSSYTYGLTVIHNVGFTVAVSGTSLNVTPGTGYTTGDLKITINRLI